MQKLHVSLFFFLFIFCSCSASELDDSIQPIEISKLVLKDNRTYLEVDGIPFPLFGAQIRLDALVNCDKYPIERIESYFAKASDLGVNCVQIPIWWNLIEPKEDKYEFSLVDDILAFALKYKLKIEVLWFSTNMCGDSFSYLVPQYILNEPGKKLKRDNNAQFWGYYGYIYSLKLDDSWILEREQKAVTKLFNHIREWDMDNGETHPVIVAQIHNEPDCLIRWRIDQYNIRFSEEEPLSKREAWDMSLNAVDAVGQAIKLSNYKVVTRVNVVKGTGIAGYYEFPDAKPKDIFDLQGIDFVCVDPYKSTIEEIKSELMAYKSIIGNYPLIAENKGTYQNTASLILASAALGGGYNIYDLATSKYFIDNTSIDYKTEIDHGVYTWDLQDKSHTNSIREILKGLVAAYPVVASSSSYDFAAFNVKQQYPLSECSQKICTTKNIIDFNTQNGAIGFCITADDRLFAYFTQKAVIKLSNGNYTGICKGFFDKQGSFIDEGTVNLLPDNILNAEKGVLYKINFSNDKSLVSTTIENIGSM